MLDLLMASVVAYAATNVDNLTVLLAFLSTSKGHTRAVINGHICGSLILVAFALGCTLLLLPLPRTYVGLLGIVPLCMGLTKLCKRWLSGAANNTAKPQASLKRPISSLMVATVAISNGSDNVAIYTPLFAGRSASDNTIVTLVLISMIGIWCLAACYLVSHPILGSRIKHYGEVALPWLLIVVGISVLHQGQVFRGFGL